MSGTKPVRRIASSPAAPAQMFRRDALLARMGSVLKTAAAFLTTPATRALPAQAAPFPTSSKTASVSHASTTVTSATITTSASSAGMGSTKIRAPASNALTTVPPVLRKELARPARVASILSSMQKGYQRGNVGRAPQKCIAKNAEQLPGNARPALTTLNSSSLPVCRQHESIST